MYFKNIENKNKYLYYTGIALLLFSSLFFIILISPILYEEIKYNLSKKDNYKTTEVIKKDEIPDISKNYIRAIDNNFSIIIPKIQVNSKVIKNVDPFKPKEYQIALAKGVAHAKGSALPNQVGNIFIFSHSSNNLLTASIYNSVFYLASKLVKDDIFYLVFENKIYKYKIIDKKIVKPNEVSYIKGNLDLKTATIMTCYPAGTNFRRLVIIGELVE